MELLFWMFLGSLAYAYAGFPACVALVAMLRQRRVRKRAITPSVSLIVAAYNEERNIGPRLDNALALDYPAHLLEILVASDGSNDRTEEIVSGYESRGVRLLRLLRRGKVHALNAAVAAAWGDILVFSDANSAYDTQALRHLVSNFADPEVGGVVGNTSYVLQPGCESSSRGESLYLRYDTWLKKMESLTGSVISAHGAMYAVRRELYPTLSEAGVTDDFAISTAVVEQQRRLVFEMEARSSEIALPRAGSEFRRRVRIITRGLRGLWMRRRLFNPLRYGFYSVILFSHKALRRLLPIPLLLLLPLCLYLAPQGGLYRIAAFAQLAFYLLAFAGYLLRRAYAGRFKVFYVPFFYCMSNAAALVALWNLITGQTIELWQPHRHEAGI